MNTPSPFEIGRAIGSNVSGAFKESRENSAIDQILSQAAQSNDPGQMTQLMGQLLQKVSPERQKVALDILQKKVDAIQQNQVMQRFAPTAFGQQGQSGQPMQGTMQQQTQPSMQQGIPGQAPMQQGGINYPLSQVPDEELVLLQGDKNYNQIARAEQKRRESERDLLQRRDEAKTKRHGDIAQKAIEFANETARTIPQKESSLKLMNEAIASKNLNFWSGDNLADLTGVEAFRSPEGAIFKTAGKEYLLGNIQRAGARPNQWIEQQIGDMLPKVGRSTAANLSVSRALQNELDLDKERVRLTNEIADKMEEGGGSLHRSLESKVQEKLSIYAEKKQKELFNDLRAIKSIEDKKPQRFMRVESGTKISKVVAQSLLRQSGNDPKKAREEAKKLGYEF